MQKFKTGSRAEKVSGEGSAVKLTSSPPPGLREDGLERSALDEIEPLTSGTHSSRECLPQEQARQHSSRKEGRARGSLPLEEKLLATDGFCRRESPSSQRVCVLATFLML